MQDVLGPLSDLVKIFGSDFSINYLLSHKVTVNFNFFCGRPIIIQIEGKTNASGTIVGTSAPGT